MKGITLRELSIREDNNIHTSQRRSSPRSATCSPHVILMESQKVMVRHEEEFVFFQLCRWKKWCSEKLSNLPWTKCLESDRDGFKIFWPWIWFSIYFRTMNGVTFIPILKSKWQSTQLSYLTPHCLFLWAHCQLLEDLPDIFYFWLASAT